MLMLNFKAEDVSLQSNPYDIGFRRIEIIDKIIYLKWKNALLLYRCKTVVYGEMQKQGRCIGIEDMKADISCLLRNNINLCVLATILIRYHGIICATMAGIYVMAETNLESHGSFQKLGAMEPSCNVPGSFHSGRVP